MKKSDPQVEKDEFENPWKTLKSEVVYDNPWIQVTHRDVITPGGSEGIYGHVHFKNLAIGIIPMDEDKNIWLVGQYRYPTGNYSWEIPEGGGPLDKDPLESAKRELLEETGLKAEKWTCIQKLHPSNSVTDEVGLIYLAENLTQHNPCPEDTEQLKIRKISLDEVLKLVFSGEISDAISIIAIFRLHWMLSRKR